MPAQNDTKGADLAGAHLMTALAIVLNDSTVTDTEKAETLLVLAGDFCAGRIEPESARPDLLRRANALVEVLTTTNAEIEQERVRVIEQWLPFAPPVLH